MGNIVLFGFQFMLGVVAAWLTVGVVVGLLVLLAGALVAWRA